MDRLVIYSMLLRIHPIRTVMLVFVVIFISYFYFIVGPRKCFIDVYFIDYRKVFDSVFSTD